MPTNTVTSFLLLLEIVPAIYVVVCAFLYFYQEKLIFFPQKLPADHVFRFTQPVQELSFTSSDNEKLNGLLFKADKMKGLIFYLHGNAGSLQSWGELAKVYTDLHYDLFMLDYRGYGKSTGSIRSEKQFYGDVQLVYDHFKQSYAEATIVVLGYSIGTGAAAKLASGNKPKLLVLQAPYFSLYDLVRHRMPLVPSFLLRYKFPVHHYLQQCSMPVIYYGSSVKLQALFKPADRLVTLPGQGHNGMSAHPGYQTALSQILRP